MRVHNATPMMADVVSGALPRPIEWCPGSDPSAWWAPAPVRQELSRQLDLERLQVVAIEPCDSIKVCMNREEFEAAALPLLVVLSGYGRIFRILSNEDGTRFAILS